MMYTNQEAFDKVVTHLVAQGRQSMNGSLGCRYKGPDGMKCAVGCLLPNTWRPEEGLSWLDLCDNNKNYEDLANVGLLQNLQEAHDIKLEYNAPTWRVQWVDHMRKVAKTYKLSTKLLAKLATKKWQSKDL